MASTPLTPIDEAPSSPDPARRGGDGPGATPPAVLAIVVSSDGEEWLPAALRTLHAQRYPRLRVLGVDSGSEDRTGQIMRQRLGEDAVISLDRNGGFSRGVMAALRSELAEQADLLLFVHDDMALMPDAVQWMVSALQADERLAAVGPKLRAWGEEPLLQQVGMTADLLGRAEAQLDPQELDQGQHDHRGDVLWVSSAGMLVRKDTFLALGGFDPRFDRFRDDLDLCWRAWMAGQRVAVEPRAVGYHLAASAEGQRIDPTDRRYRIERHTLAALLKNYSAPRLALALAVGAVAHLATFLGLLLSRRFGEAFAIIRAYLWNLAQLPATLTRRRAIQQRRRVSDDTLKSLFASGLPRLSRYSDAFLEVVAGGSTKALVDADELVGTLGADPLADQPLRKFMRDRPLLLVGVPLLIAFLASLRGLLSEGPIIGGQIAAWPDSPLAFFRAYLSPWGGEPLASSSFPSPVQPVLGLLSALLGGSAWLAQRALTFGLVPLAFLTMLRAGRLITPRPWPRVLGAAIYALSPVVLGALGEGRYGLAVLAALLPAVVSLTIRTTNPETPPGVAWRSTALMSLAVLLALGAAPVEGLLAPTIVIVAGVIALLRGWIRSVLRLSVGGGAALVMLAPWLLDVWRNGGPPGETLSSAGGPAAIVDLPLWRALTLQPQVVDGLGGALGWVLLAVPAAVVLGALVVGMRARPLITGSLLLLAVTSGAAGWAAAEYRLPLVWPPALLLPGVLATAVLVIIIARWSMQTLTSSDFGAGQIGTGLAGIGVVVGVVAGMFLLAGGPWTQLAQDPRLVPAFIGTDVADTGPYRVLVLARADDGALTWELSEGEGPSMVAFGTIRSLELTELIGDTVTQLVSGSGDEPAGVLGLLNIRYVVLTQPDPVLHEALVRQPAIEPLPTTVAATYEVSAWVPRASVMAEPTATRLRTGGVPSVEQPAALIPQEGASTYQGGVAGEQGGLLVLSEEASAAWRAGDATGELERVEVPHVNAWAVPPGSTGPFRVVAAGGLRRRAVVAAQLLVALLMISLAIRPPGARTREPQEPRALPSDLVGLADTTTMIPRIDPSAPPPGAGPPTGEGERS